MSIMPDHLLKQLLNSPNLTAEQLNILQSVTAISPPPPIYTLQQGINSMANAAYGQTVTTAGNSGITYYPPTPAPNSFPVYTIPVPQGQMAFFITPIQNGFLIGTEGALTERCKYCKDYSEIAEAIIAMLALNKLTEK